MEEIRPIVRIVGVDVPGELSIERALWRIKGISFMYAHAVRIVGGWDKNRKVGTLTDEEIQKLEDIIKNPQKYGIPSWLYNRRKDYETGQDIHLVTSELEITKKMDYRRLRLIKSWRGLRLAWGLKVRGQRTKSHPRRSGPIGVKRRK